MNRACALLLALTLVAGCGGESWEPEALGRGATSAARRELQLGRRVYSTYCIGCHGEAGDGNGPAARFLDPKPRDFRSGKLKFAAVASGETPRDEDYLRVLEHGLLGTAMPAFALLPLQERRAVVAYVRAFETARPHAAAGDVVQVGSDPWARNPARGVAAGQRAYHAIAKCWSCHPAYESRADIARHHAESQLPAPELGPGIYVSQVKDSQWGAPIRAPDFLADRVKTGTEVASLVHVIAAGVGGTAMPTWGGALTPQELWGLAHYVRSLALLRGTAEARELRLRLAAHAAADSNSADSGRSPR
jgi:mono/diheme cytochrome c family protein